jgi:chorismate mutase
LLHQAILPNLGLSTQRMPVACFGCCLSATRRFPVPVRAVRGATQIEANDREEIVAATAELVAEVMARNDLTTEDVISVLFTATPDLDAEFPALAARTIGFHDVPLMCASEIGVPHALPRVIRLMAHVETDRPRSDVAHVYLRGAATLRLDIAQ